MSKALADEAVMVKKIEIVGLKYSEPRVVLRELPFQEGSFWQSSYAQTSERLLRNLGVFSDATVFPPDDEGHVRIVVSDRWPFWLLPEATRRDGGASRVGLVLNDYNLWGLHHDLRFSSSIDTGKNFSGNNGKSYQFSYLWRRIADSKYSVDMGVNRGDSALDVFKNGILSSTYFQHVQEGLLGANYGFGAVPGEGWDGRIGVTTSQKSFILKSGSAQADVQDRTRNAVNIKASYRLVDDHITWLTGMTFDYKMDVAHAAFGSDINVVRQSMSWRNYVPLQQQRTINMRINAGWADGDLLRDGLYDLGDGKGLRGYLPGDVQGSAYLYGTLESRIPLELNSNVIWVAFADVGHVTDSGRRALGKSVIAGVGTGVRWTLRWLINGTLRADVAYGTALHRWRVHLGTGQAF